MRQFGDDNEQTYIMSWSRLKKKRLKKYRDSEKEKNHNFFDLKILRTQKKKTDR